MKTENQSHKLWKIIKSRDRALERAKEVIQELRQREQKTGEGWHELQNHNNKLETVLAEKNAALAAERQLVSHLRDQLQSIEMVRSRLINELYQANHQLHQSNYQLHQANHQLQDDIESGKQELAHCQQEIAFLSTNKAAIRKLIKTFLNKVKIYDFFYERYKFLVPIYNFIFRDKWKPSTIYHPISSVSHNLVASGDVGNTGEAVSATKNEDANSKAQHIDMASPTIEAWLIHRHFDEKINLDYLEVISGFIFSFSNVLCINPSPQILLLLQSLAQKEIKVTCVGCKETQAHFSTHGFEITSLEFGDWMVATGKVNLWEYDALLLNSEIPQETLMLMNGRLSPKTKILVNGAILND